MGEPNQMEFWQNCKANTLAGAEGHPWGLPSKHWVRRANTGNYTANRCALLKPMSAADSTGGRRPAGEQGPLAAEPVVTDTLISILFPVPDLAWRCATLQGGQKEKEKLSWQSRILWPGHLPRARWKPTSGCPRDHGMRDRWQA